MVRENYTIKDIQEGFQKKEFSAEEIFNHYSVKIGLENKKLNAFLSTFNFQDSQASRPRLDSVEDGSNVKNTAQNRKSLRITF